MLDSLSFSSISSSIDHLDEFPKSSCCLDEIVIQKRISEAKFSLFIVECPSSKRKFVMKVFPHKNGKPSSYYRNEVRFSLLKHPHIINFVHQEDFREFQFENMSISGSILLMEYAPFGDFSHLITNSRTIWDIKLIRTFFHQLIEGLEFLHGQDVSHLDIKPENLLLSHDFQLKICDFDLSYKKGDKKIKGRGTMFYRAPELENDTCLDTQAADIYSAAFVLFFMKTGGTSPLLKNGFYKGLDMSDILHNKIDLFWEIHDEIRGYPNNFYDESFKELFTGMTREDPNIRWKISDIKKSKWYNGEIYSKDQVKQYFLRFLYYS